MTALSYQVSQSIVITLDHIGVVTLPLQSTQGGMGSFGFVCRRKHRVARISAVVGVKNQTLWIDVEAETRLQKQPCAIVIGFFQIHRGRYNLAAPDIHDQVQIKELAENRALQVGDIPRPDLTRSGGHMFFWLAAGGRPGGFPVSHVALVS